MGSPGEVRAVGLTRYGGPEVLRELTVPREVLGRGDVRVAVAAATVNPADTLLRIGALSGGLDRPESILVPGLEIAGTVVEGGPGTDRTSPPGAHVMAMVRPHTAHGGYRANIVLPATAVALAPRNTSLVAAATLPMNGLTALVAIDSLQLPSGAVIAVTGAAGAVGGYVVQLAKASGIKVVADASAEDAQTVQALGADSVVPRGCEVAAHIRSEFPCGVDALVDAAVQSDVVVPAVKDGGIVIAVRGESHQCERGVRRVAIRAGTYAGDRAKLDRLRRLVEDGALTLRVARTFAADQAAEAHRQLEAGGTRGRLVLTF